MMEAADIALAVALDNLEEVYNKFEKNQVTQTRLCYDTSAGVASHSSRRPKNNNKMGLYRIFILYTSITFLIEKEKAFICLAICPLQKFYLQQNLPRKIIKTKCIMPSLLHSYKFI